jgi:hypothetical protein
METEKNKPEAAGIEVGPMEGTKDMGYWDFKKQVCDNAGWQLRRIDPQTYQVIDSKHEKIGIFKSGEGYFPNPEAVADAEAPPKSV